MNTRRRPAQKIVAWDQSLGWDRLGHDLRQPLQSMLLSAHLVANTKDAAKRQREGLRLERALLALHDVVELIAALVRLELATAPAGREPVTLADVVRDAVSDTAEILGELGVTIQATGVGGRVDSNARLLQQLVAALIANAASTAAGGAIALDCGRAKGVERITVAFTPAAGAAWEAPNLFVEVGAVGHCQTVIGLPLAARLGSHIGAALHVEKRAADRVALVLEFAPLTSRRKAPQAGSPTSRT